MNLIWLSDLLNNDQTAVGIRVLTDRAKCCPTQVFSASAQWCQWCPTVVTRADCPGTAEDQLRTWPGWLGAELGPDEIFLDAAYFHISLMGGLVVQQTLPCGLGLHKYAWTNLGPRQWLKFWTTTMCIWVFAFGYSDELRTFTCHVCWVR